MDEMAWLVSEKFIGLKESFVEKEMKGIMMGMASHDLLSRKLPLGTGILCPFCHVGEIVLKEIKPDYSGGMRAFPSTLHHVGNTYTFRCECGGYFTYHDQWMWID